MLPSELARRRLAAQRLDRPGDVASIPALVAWFGAIQAQDHAGSKWAIGVRLAGSRESAIEDALSRGAILRTHAFRMTWQLVTPTDIHWMLALVAPRIRSRARRRLAQLELDAATLRRSNAALEKILRDGHHRTRSEVASALARASIPTEGQRLSHLLAHAELDGVVCSGAPRGNDSTYALLQERAPAPRRVVPPDEALAELARRYVRSRGPATVTDFAWWSGLAVTEARAAFEAIRSETVVETARGRTWFFAEDAATAATKAGAWLLPPFDEWLVAYRSRDDVLDPKFAPRVNAGGGLLAPCVVVDGRVVGVWRRKIAKTAVEIAVEPFEPLAPRIERSIRIGADRYAAFLGLEANVTIA